MTASLNLAGDNRINQGATYRLTIVWNDPDGEPIDLTDYDARLQLRERAESAVLIDLTVANGGLTLTPLEGRIAVLITAVQTADLAVRHAVYDLHLSAPDGTVTRLLEGTVQISPAVTRDD